MSVEGGTISLGGIDGAAVGIGSTQNFGSLAAFGPKLEAPTISFVNEGPVKGGLENTMPYQLGMFNPIGSIKFSPKIGSDFGELSTEVAVVLSQTPRPRLGDVEVPKVFQARLSDVNLDPQSDPVAETMQVSGITAISGIDISPANIEIQSTAKVEPIIVSDASKLAAVRATISGLEPAPKSKGVLLTQAATQPQAEIKVASGPAAQALVLEDQQVEELIEKTVAVKYEDDQIESRQNEASEEVKIQRVVDEPVVKQRIEEIIAAAIAVQLEKKDAEGVIAGQKIVEKLPFQHKKNRSGELNIVEPEGKLLDGSLLATIKRIASGKFNSLLDVIKKAPEIVAKDIPVTRGEGQLVTDEDVAKVYEEYKGKIPPAQQVFRRVVTMVKQVKIVERYEEVVEKNEGTLHPELAAALLVPKDFQK